MALWEEKHSLAFLGVWGILALKLLVYPQQKLFSSSVIALLKFKIILEVLNYHPHSAAETVKKGQEHV